MSSWMPGKTLEQIEKEAIQQAFKFYQGNKTQTAASLGIAIRTLDSKLEKYEAERIDHEKRMKDADEREKLFRDRSRGNVAAINAAANSSIRSHSQPTQEARTIQNGDGTSSGLRMESSQEVTSEHAMSMSKREEVQGLSSRPASSSNTKRAR